VFLYAEDLQQTYTELSARGVRFPLAPVEQPFGWWSLFQDPDGNRFALVPRAVGAPALGDRRQDSTGSARPTG
jgi:predicted enzyme related to lactoylglutathione lyase